MMQIGLMQRSAKILPLKGIAPQSRMAAHFDPRWFESTQTKIHISGSYLAY